MIEAPAEADAVIVPSARPLQLTLVDDALTVTAIGSVIVTVVVAVQHGRLTGDDSLLPN